MGLINIVHLLSNNVVKEKVVMCNIYTYLVGGIQNILDLWCMFLF